ncbi:MAG: NUDIX domain-containing protein [Thermoproteus sp.]|nr:NUDIX domain-containing protein [Thermoproteus sp.]
MRKCVVASGILIEGGRALMVYHERLGVWLYPGGHVEQGETPSEAVVREFREETGLVVEPVGTTLGISGDGVVEEPLPFAILRETVRYPHETHIHYDLVFLVRRLGGSLNNGMWISEAELDGLKTYTNVRQVLRRAFSAVR